MTEPNWALVRKKGTLIRRAEILQAIREFFSERSYLEVETPHRVPANAPEAHIEQVVSGDWVMHTSPELAMKRLLAAGYEKTFQLCRVWRDGERGRLHVPEFTMLEWYRAGVDYNALMDECEELLQYLVPDKTLYRSGRPIDLGGPWERLTLEEAFDKHASKSLQTAIAQDLFEELLTGEVEPQLGKRKPVFLTEYPATMAALARTKPDNPQAAERFELYIDGLEVANAFSELTDPQEQRRRFQSAEESRQLQGMSPRPLPEPFLAEMPAMPEAAGIALGVDRLVMLLVDANRIDEVVAFTPEEL